MVIARNLSGSHEAKEEGEERSLERGMSIWIGIGFYWFGPSLNGACVPFSLLLEEEGVGFVGKETGCSVSTEFEPPSHHLLALPSNCLRAMLGSSERSALSTRVCERVYTVVRTWCSGVRSGMVCLGACFVGEHCVWSLVGEKISLQL